MSARERYVSEYFQVPSLCGERSVTWRSMAIGRMNNTSDPDSDAPTRPVEYSEPAVRGRRECYEQASGYGLIAVTVVRLGPRVPD